jgi:hypothetical protein
MLARMTFATFFAALFLFCVACGGMNHAERQALREGACQKAIGRSQFAYTRAGFNCVKENGELAPVLDPTRMLGD